MLRTSVYIFRSKFDIIEAAEGGFEQLFFIFLKKCPIVTRLNGNFRYIYMIRCPFTYLVDKLENFVVKKSDNIISPSLSYAKTISRDYRIPFKKIRVIPYGINIRNINEFKKEDIKIRYPKSIGKKLILLSVGDSPRRKGADMFIKVASGIPQDNLLFILLCSKRSLLNFKRLPDNLLLLGNLNRDNFYSLICASEIIVFPSYFESFCIAVREAMLFNKIIVVSQNVPLDEMENKYSKLVILKSINPNELASTILNIVGQEKKFPDIDEELRQYLINKYDISKIGGVTEDFYKKTFEEFKKKLWM
jgi:glycosyltransferase involved in cell wall biosynthesis